MRYFILLLAMFGLFYGGTGGCGGSGNIAGSGSPAGSTGSDICLTMKNLSCDRSPALYNGTYSTGDDVNSCDDVLLFRSQIEITNASSIGFTWTDQDGQFFGRFLSADQDGDGSIYEVDLFGSSIACVTNFFTDTGNGTSDIPLDVMKVVCLASNFGCEVTYAKPTE